MIPGVAKQPPAHQGQSLEAWVVADVQQFKVGEEWGGLVMGRLL